jgi:hypothetical protein
MFSVWSFQVSAAARAEMGPAPQAQARVAIKACLRRRKCLEFISLVRIFELLSICQFASSILAARRFFRLEELEVFVGTSFSDGQPVLLWPTLPMRLKVV